MKHATQIVIPDLLLVTDATEEAQGCTPKHGLQHVIDKAVDKIHPTNEAE
jgi:hypothetical protein